MAIKWSQVAEKPEFLALSPEDQEETRQMYFDDVVVPQLDPADIDDAWALFDEDTRLTPASSTDPADYQPGIGAQVAGALPGIGPMASAAATMGREGVEEYMPNVLKGAAERTGDLYANLTRFVDKLGEGGDESAAYAGSATTPGRMLGYGTAKLIDLAQSALGDPEQLGAVGEPDTSILERLAQGIETTADLGYEEQTKWDDVKNDWTKLPAYAFEKGIASLPDMAAAIGAPVPYIFARSYELADERATNLDMAEPTSDMVSAAIVPALALAASERIGGKAALGIGQGATSAFRGIAGAAGKEGGTEFLQEGAEYAYGAAGTGKYDPWENLDRALAGAAVGGPTGGALRTGAEAVSLPMRIADIEDEVGAARGALAQDLDAIIPDPQRILDQSSEATIEERENSVMTEAASQVDALAAEIEEPAPAPAAIDTEVVEEIEAAPPPVSNEEMRGMTVDEAMGTLTEGHDAGTLRMTPDEFGALVEDIKENGIREPITLETGIRPGALTLTDGRHRLLAAKAAGLKAVPVQVDPQAAPVEAVPEVTLEPEAVESPVTAPIAEAAPTPSANEIARPETKRGRLAAKYKEIGGKRDPKTKGWTFRSVDRKRVERAEGIFGDSDVVATPDVGGSFKEYVKARGFEGQKLTRDEMKAVRSDYRASLESQRDKIQTTPTDLTVSDSMVDKLRYTFQDKFLGLKKLEEVGAQVSDVGAYQTEELYHGRASARVDNIKTDYVDPVTSILADHKLKVQDLNDYMQALHAPEANAELKRRNPERDNNEALSGMSDADAAAVVAKWKGNAGMKQAATFVRDMNDATADIIESEGLEPGDVVQEWRDLYKNYVPLHRKGKGDAASKGKGFSIRGREAQARVGSEDQVVDVVAHSVQNHAREIVRAEKNRVGRALLNFARANQDENFWKVDPVESVRRLDPKTGLVTTAPDPSYQTADNVFMVKEDGQTHHITFNTDNPVAMKLARAMKNLDADQSNTVMQGMQKVNRFLSAVNTSFNPEFVLSNFFRDLQTAGIKMESTEAAGLQKQVVKDIPKALKGIWKGQRGKGETEWTKHYDEFRMAGGKTGWIDATQDVASQVKALESAVASHSGTYRHRATGVLKSVGTLVNDINSTVENGVRLSAYVNARRSGMSKENAASLSKNLTVNFNRKGAAGPGMNAAFLFFNAGVQGSANVISSLRSRRVQKLAAGLVVASAGLALANREMGGEDEDGIPNYDKIGHWEKERNLIIMNPFSEIEGIPDAKKGDYFKIPLPYGYNIFKVVGDQIADAYGKEDYNVMDSMGQVASALAGSFNPIGSDASWLQFIAPTVADPIAQIYENKTFYGAPLRPENRYGADKADAELYFRSARDTSVSVAKALNELTGGSKYRSGLVDVSPETLDLWVDFLTGGAGRTAADFGGTMVDLLAGEERHTRRVPGLRKFYSAAPDTWTPRTYFEYKKEIDTFEAELKNTAKARDRAALEPFRGDPRRKMMRPLKAAERILRLAYKGRDKLEAAQPEGWEEKTKVLEDRIEEVRKRFIVLYRDAIL